MSASPGSQGAQRIADGGRDAVREHADRQRQGVRRPGRQRVRARANPDERALRVGQRARRHVRAGQLPRVRAGLSWRWAGAKWDTLPAAHFTSILWGLIALAGLGMVALRSAAGASPSPSRSRGPLTRSRKVSSSNSNDTSCRPSSSGPSSSPPSSRVRAASSSASRRGRSSLRSCSCPSGRRIRSGWPRQKLAYAAAFCCRRARPPGFLLARPDLAPRRRASSGTRSAGSWFARHHSPSGTGTSTATPTSHVVQTGLKIASCRCGSPCTSCRARRIPDQARGALGRAHDRVELMLTHWFYLYIPWFFPFVARCPRAVVARGSPEEAVEPERPVRAWFRTG